MLTIIFFTALVALLWRANLNQEAAAPSPQTLTARVAGQSFRFNPETLLAAARAEEEQQ